MSPLLYIFLISVFLLLVLYLVLLSIDFQQKAREAIRKRYYDFETSQELFRFLKPTENLKKDEQQKDE